MTSPVQLAQYSQDPDGAADRDHLDVGDLASENKARHLFDLGSALPPFGLRPSRRDSGPAARVVVRPLLPGATRRGSSPSPAWARWSPTPPHGAGRRTAARRRPRTNAPGR